MRNFTLILIIAVFSAINVNAQNIEWGRKITGAGNVTLLRIISDINNNTYYTAEYTGTVSVGGQTFTATSRDILVAKYDADGVFKWVNRIYSPTTNYGADVAVSDDGTAVYVVGRFTGTCYFDATTTLTSTDTYSDAFAAKYNSDGTLVWAKNIGKGTNTQWATSLTVDKDNNIVIIGSFMNQICFNGTDYYSSNGFRNHFAVKFDSNGNYQWHKIYQGTSNNTGFKRVKAVTDGYVFSGQFVNDLSFDLGTITSTDSYADVFIYKMNTTGTGQWLRKIRGAGKVLNNACAVNNTGDVFVTGSYEISNLIFDSTATTVSTFSPSTQGLGDAYLAMYSSSGVLQWAKSIGSTGEDQGIGLGVYENALSLAGTFTGTVNFGDSTLTSSGSNDAFLAVFTAVNGNFEFVKAVKGTVVETGKMTCIDASRNYYLGSEYTSTSITADDSSYTNTNANSDAVIIKYKQNKYNATFHITDGTNPVSGASVDFNSVVYTTDLSGKTTVNFLTNNSYNYTVSALGYYPASGTVTINSKDTTINIALSMLPKTKLKTNSCGISTSNRATVLYCDRKTGEQAYEFRFINSSLGFDKTISNPYDPLRYYVQFSNVPGILNGYEYKVLVRVKISGQWSFWGDTCSTYLTIGTTKLSASSCGSTSTSRSTVLYCDRVSGEEAYEFNFFNNSIGFNQTISNPADPKRYYIQYSDVPGILNATTYYVRVRAKVSGQWGAWGDTCTATLGNFTQLTGVSCGLVTSDLNSTVYCDRVSGEQAYEFEFVNTTIGFSKTVSNPSDPSRYYIQLSNVTGIQAGYTYDVKVRAKVNGTWGSFGTVCQVTLNGGVTTKLTTSSCGLTTTTASTTIYCDRVTGEQAYEFKFSNAGLGFSQTNSNPTDPKRYYIQLSNITGILYGYTYDVQVRAMVNGQWTNWGTTCQVTLNVGTTKLGTTSCGLTTSNIATTIYCTRISGEQAYEFEFVNSSIGFSQVLSNPADPKRYYLQLSNVPGIQRGYTYDVRVRGKASGNWGAWGDVCQVTLNSTKSETAELFTFSDNNLRVYPNPVNDILNFEITTNFSGVYNIEITDITGRIMLSETGYIENRIYTGMKDIGDWENGIYIINFYTNNEKITQRFIKQ